MKCHYEVLNVPREADEGEIKLAYKKLALKWHPDKNLDNVEYATEQFQLVQQAYEILSDRQERAWYDNHREQILRGSSSDFKDDHLDVYQYFTTTCFKAYDDADNGFYTVYGNVFEQIAKEDLEYMKFKEDFCNIPMFGNSTSDYDQVVAPFYDFWVSYSTKKSYVWLDPYNIKEAKNRRILKLIDKENEKIRQKARKERNEEVRGLVAFVRKRDKRVHLHSKLLETKKIENRQKQERISKQKRLERLKQLDETSEQAEWMKFENVKSELEEIEKNLAQQFGDDASDGERNGDSEEELDHLYCVACNKIFKNPKAFENHESSKKHRENVEHLKQSMINEDEELEAISKSAPSDFYTSNGSLSVSDDDELDDLYCVICDKMFKNPKAFSNHESSRKHRENIERLKEDTKELLNASGSASNDKLSGDEILEWLHCENCNCTFKYCKEFVNQKSSKKHEGKVEERNENIIGPVLNEFGSTATLSDDESGDVLFGKTVRNSDAIDADKVSLDNKNSNGKLNHVDMSIPEEEIEFERTEKTKKEKKNSKPKNKMAKEKVKDTSKSDSRSPAESDDDSIKATSKKQKRKKRKENKLNGSRPKIEVANDIENNISETPEISTVKSRNQKEFKKGKRMSADAETVDIDHTCVICKADFSSKNKLFHHLKQTGHSVRIEQNAKTEKKNTSMIKEK